MIEVAHAGVDYSKETGDYQNHTHNLRSAPGSAVVINGEIVDMYVPAEPGHEDAKSKTENLLIYGKRPQTELSLPMVWNTHLTLRARDVRSFLRALYISLRKSVRNLVNNHYFISYGRIEI